MYQGIYLEDGEHEHIRGSLLLKLLSVHPGHLRQLGG
jgi:hypothetical protein